MHQTNSTVLNIDLEPGVPFQKSMHTFHEGTDDFFRFLAVIYGYQIVETFAVERIRLCKKLNAIAVVVIRNRRFECRRAIMRPAARPRRASAM